MTAAILLQNKYRIGRRLQPRFRRTARSCNAEAAICGLRSLEVLECNILKDEDLPSMRLLSGEFFAAGLSSRQGVP
jgi:hypothetical protein